SAPSTYNSTRTTPTLSPVVTGTETVRWMVAPSTGDAMATFGGVVSATLLLTVTLTDALELFWAASRAVAVSVWAPLATVRVSQPKLYGAVASLVTNTPSTARLTEVTPTLSLASTCTAIVPASVAPDAGPATATVGGVASGGGPPCPTAIWTAAAALTRPVP